MPRNVKYVTSWTTAKASWKLEIVPADTSILPVAASEVELAGDAVNVIDDLDGKFFDKLPIGPQAADKLSVEFDLRYLPDDLITYLNEPVIEDGGEDAR